MKNIRVIWKGGPKWDPSSLSSFSGKNKTAFEHLIETGGNTLDEAISTYEQFKKMPIEVEQLSSTDPDINWITEIKISESDPDKNKAVVDQITKIYQNRQQILKNGQTGYSIELQFN